MDFIIEQSSVDCTGKLQKNNWVAELKNVITDSKVLMKKLELSPEQTASWIFDSPFPLKVTEHYLSNIQKGNPDDPLLKQLAPLISEQDSPQDYKLEPLDESKQFTPVLGLIHKYQSRVLLTLTGHCAVHCRYCFRRNFPYEQNNVGHSGFLEQLNYIRSHPNINEVIFSGGDPLILPDRVLSKKIAALNSIENIKWLRIHSRMPTVLPNRITPELIEILAENKKKISIVIHVNHPRELDSKVKSVLKNLQNHNIPVFNQSVLLKSVNNCPEILASLSEELWSVGVIPYYLHQLDKVKGSHNFEVPFSEAQAIYNELRKQLPGFLLPKWVKEIPGAVAKVTI
jgi:EF-P beta-lysylation protein EpmB